MRIFIVDGREFPDPDPSLTVDEVRESWTNWFPELSNATTQERKDGETTYIEFRKTVGTKGRPTGRRTAFRGELPGEYLKQIQHGLWLTGAQWCDFVSFDDRFPPALQLFRIRVMRDETAIREYEAKAKAFLLEVDAEVQKVQDMVVAEKVAAL